MYSTRRQRRHDHKMLVNYYNYFYSDFLVSKTKQSLFLMQSIWLYAVEGGPTFSWEHHAPFVSYHEQKTDY